MSLRIIFSLLLLVIALGITPGPCPAGESFIPKSTAPNEVMEYVERAVNLILDKGQDHAFKVLTDPQGPWVGGQYYLFINSFKGYILAHLNKKLVGRTLLHIRDVKGNAFYAELQRIGQSEKGRGWAKYWWPRAGSNTPEIKACFIMAVPGRRMWVGTGLYGLTESQIDELIAKFNH